MGAVVYFIFGVGVLERGCGVLYKHYFACGTCGGGMVDGKEGGVSLS